MTLKLCTKCCRVLPESEFWKRKDTEDGLTYFCKQCFRDKHKIYYQTHKQIWQDYEKENYDRIITRKRQLYQEMKLSILIHYGGNPPKCSCCGEDHIEFLTINHINNNGAEHRKSFGGRNYSWYIYRDIIEKGFPEGYNVLCYNCNCSIGFHGYCPHQK